MKKGTALFLLVILAASCAQREETSPGVETTSIETSTSTTSTSLPPTTTTSTTTTTLPPSTTTTAPSGLPSVSELESGLFCRDLRDLGYDYPDAIAYWVRERYTDRMDADRNGIPCETIWSEAEVDAFWFQTPVSTTLPPTPVEKPAACDETPQGVATFATSADFRAALVGKWFLCNPGSPTPYYHPLGGTVEGVIGVEFFADDRYQYLGGTADDPIALTGWGNEGIYILQDEPSMPSRTSYQMDLKPAGEPGWSGAFIEFTTDLRFFGVDTYNGNSIYTRIG